MPDANLFAGIQFFQFHAVQQRFIDAVGDSAAEGRRVVILFHFPNRDRVYHGWKGAIHAPREGSYW